MFDCRGYKKGSDDVLVPHEGQVVRDTDRTGDLGM